MSIRVYCWTIFLVYAGVAQAGLGGNPDQFNTQGVTVASSTTITAANYAVYDTTLNSGVHIREYVSGGGAIFAVTWNGPVQPDLKMLLGNYFDLMITEAHRMPQASRSGLNVKRSDVVINTSGHMRSFSGSAWLPGQIPPNFTEDDIH